MEAYQLAHEYRKSPRFKDIYLYIMEGKLPSNQQAQKCIRADALNYVVINGLLYRIDCRKQITVDDSPLLLVIPEKFELCIFNLYHDSLLAGHQGPWKTNLTLR